MKLIKGSQKEPHIYVQVYKLYTSPRKYYTYCSSHKNAQKLNHFNAHKSALLARNLKIKSCDLNIFMYSWEKVGDRRIAVIQLLRGEIVGMGGVYKWSESCPMVGLCIIVPEIYSS